VAEEEGEHSIERGRDRDARQVAFLGSDAAPNSPRAA